VKVRSYGVTAALLSATIWMTHVASAEPVPGHVASAEPVPGMGNA
jgi:hypothetical protein